MRFFSTLLIIIFFLTLAYSVNAENAQVSGSTPLNLSLYEFISANSVLINVNVTSNNTTSVNAKAFVDTDLEFVSKMSYGKMTFNITRYSASPVDTDLSSLNTVSLKYINTSTDKELKSSHLAWKLIKIYYADTELDAAGVVEDSLAMYWYNITSSQWIELSTSLDRVFGVGVNTSVKYVWANSTFFSLYAIGGLKANGQSCSADVECYSNICCSGACQSSCPTVTTTPAVGGGGGPVRAPAVVAKISNFTIDKDFIKILLKPGGTEKRLIDISNIGETNLSITVNLRNLEDFLVFPGGVSEYTFDLSVGETKSIQLNFYAAEEQELGVFPGKVIVIGDGIEKLITIVVEVESIKPLFDINVEIPQRYKEVLPGDDVLVQLIVYNLKRIGPVDVNVEYGIKDAEGNMIVSEHETLAVEMRVSIVRSLDVPFDIKPGNYVLYATVKYDDTLGTGTDIFRVVTEKGVEIQTVIILSLVIIVLILTVVVVILTLYKRKHRIYVYKRNNIEIIKDMKKRMRRKR